MIRFALAAVFVAALLLPSAPARAEENVFASVSDGGTQTVVVPAGGSAPRTVALQCPGQVVSYRTGSATEPHDGGRSIQVDFVSLPDPYKIPLGPGKDRVHLKNTDGGIVDCALGLVQLQ